MLTPYESTIYTYCLFAPTAVSFLVHHQNSINICCMYKCTTQIVIPRDIICSISTTCLTMNLSPHSAPSPTPQKHIATCRQSKSTLWKTAGETLIESKSELCLRWFKQLPGALEVGVIQGFLTLVYYLPPTLYHRVWILV